MRICGHQKVLIYARMIEIVSHRSQQTAHCLQRGQMIFDFRLFDKAMHRLTDVSRVDIIVIRIRVVVAVLEQTCKMSEENSPRELKRIEVNPKQTKERTKAFPNVGHVKPVNANEVVLGEEMH